MDLIASHDWFVRKRVSYKFSWTSPFIRVLMLINAAFSNAPTLRAAKGRDKPYKNKRVHNMSYIRD